jgi:eukaryotic-like serine/threonine-protein kinase
MDPKMDPTDDLQASPQAVDWDPDATAANTTERTLWRAATVVADDDADVNPVSEEGTSIDALGRYQLREVLGAGGMGEVRLCRDAAIGRDVALKTLLDARQGSDIAQRRFLREVRVQGQLEHPAIVPVYDLGTAPDGGIFFTMRRVRGHTLEEVLGKLARNEPESAGSYSRRKLLDAFVRVCLAVDYAHARGVIHRDLKPANVMFGDFGEVHLLDWGVARLVADHATSVPVVVPRAQLAGQGSRVGTPGYMSPEQILGISKTQDARTDVYSLGAILFEILTLRRLNVGRSFAEIFKATLDREPLTASIGPDVAPELGAACARATAREPRERYASARELASAVERYLDGDRDLERRRELAIERASAAAEAAARAATPNASEEEASLARADAVREVSAALAFDTENAEARRLLVRLFVEAPSHMPREVETEIAAAAYRSRVQFLRFGSYAFLHWLLTLPFVIAMGVRSWPPVLLCSGLCLISLLYALWLRRAHTIGRAFILICLVFATIASAACWMGPFVLVPQVIAVATLWVALYCHTRRERWIAVGIGVLAVVLPFLVEIAAVFPPAFVFANGDIILAARAVRFSHHGTLAMLIYASVTHVALPALYFGGVREVLTAAEKQLFLQAWHLRQLFREAPPSA